MLGPDACVNGTMRATRAGPEPICSLRSGGAACEAGAATSTGPCQSDPLIEPHAATDRQSPNTHIARTPPAQHSRRGLEASRHQPSLLGGRVIRAKLQFAYLQIP